MKKLSLGIRVVLGIILFPLCGVVAILIGLAVWVEDFFLGHPGKREKK